MELSQMIRKSESKIKDMQKEINTKVSKLFASFFEPIMYTSEMFLHRKSTDFTTSLNLHAIYNYYILSSVLALLKIEYLLKI